MNAPNRGREALQTVVSIALPSRENGKERAAMPTPFFLDILFIQGRLETSPISDDEPTMLVEDPPQHDARRRRNGRRNVRQHHEAEERDPAQPVS
jgi:hypothetical protein